MAAHFRRLSVAGPTHRLSAGGCLGIDTAGFSAANNNSLAYLHSEAVNRALVWMDRAGKTLSTVGKPAAYGLFSLSPDQKSIVVETYTGVARNWDIWREDLAQGVLSRFTFQTGFNRAPVWSRDGSRVAYTVNNDLYVKPAAGNAAEELLLKGSGRPYDWSPDNQWIVCQRGNTYSAAGLWLVPVTKGREPVAYLTSSASNRAPRFSPDGKWMAYVSDESGQDRVYIQSVPTSGAKYQVSAGGGTDPQWRADGKELYYVSPDLKLMAVPLKIGATVEFAAPQPLFTVPARAHWNVNYAAVYAPA